MSLRPDNHQFKEVKISLEISLLAPGGCVSWKGGTALENQLEMHPHELCVPAAGCCVAAATLLNCFPSPAKARSDALLELSGSCQRGALRWAGRELRGWGCCRERLCPPSAPREWLSLGGALWGTEVTTTVQQTPTPGRAG